MNDIKKLDIKTEIENLEKLIVWARKEWREWTSFIKEAEKKIKLLKK